MISPRFGEVKISKKELNRTSDKRGMSAHPIGGWLAIGGVGPSYIVVANENFGLVPSLNQNFKFGGSFCGSLERSMKRIKYLALTTPCQALMVCVGWYHLVLSFRSVWVVIS